MCGILCQISKRQITLNIFLELLCSLQHRGQDSFGYSYLDSNNKMNIINIKGLIKKYKIETNISSTLFMGHTRYTTSGTKDNNIYQPIKGISQFGEFVFIFNGNIPLNNNIVDTEVIKEFLENKNITIDSFENLLIKFIHHFKRAYSIIIYINNNIYLIRDKYGVRPLLYKIEDDNIIISSELNEVNLNEVTPGEIIKIDTINLDYNIVYKYDSKIKALCLFEYIYFMNKNTNWNNININIIREKYGMVLAKNELSSIINNKNEYIVIGIPNSGIPSGNEYAKTINIEYQQYITKNKNINRTFILKDDNERTLVSSRKYIFNKNLKNKKIIIVDDSIVRGITIKTLIKNLRLIGVKEIHIRIASPQIKYTCYYGIDIPTKEELLVNKFNNIEDIIQFIGCDSLIYLDINKFKDIMPNFNDLCTGCFNNNYKELEW